MAFKNYEELIGMAKTNPKQAHALVAKAQKRNIPIVSDSNTGYDRTSAMKRRMNRSKTGTEEIIESRKYNG